MKGRTLIHSNAMIGMGAICTIALGLGYMLLQNELPAERFMFIGSLLKDCVLAIVGITWYFSKRPAERVDSEESDAVS